MDNEWKNEKGKWDLEKIAIECISQLRKLGIPIGCITYIKVCRDRFVTGKLAKVQECLFGLYIPNIYRSPRYGLEEIKTVIFHQLLHSAGGCMDHGEKWEKYAAKVDREYGCHILDRAPLNLKPMANWETGSKGKKNSGRFCYLDYTQRLMEIVGECAEELKNIHLPVGKVTAVQFVREKNVYGRCRKNKDGTFTILVSQAYGSSEADIYGLKKLLYHELLHTCPEDDFSPYTGIHGPKWRMMARKVDREFDCQLMGQSFTDVIKKASKPASVRFACPRCGGYRSVYDERDVRGLDLSEGVLCTWCFTRMNIIWGMDINVLGTMYSLLGECQDELRILKIPIYKISGAGFVKGDSPNGPHDNWNGSFSIDLPEIYNSREALEGNKFRAYLYGELIKGSRDRGLQWQEYVREVESVFGLPIITTGQQD